MVELATEHGPRPTRTKRLADVSRSPAKPLISDEAIASAASAMREDLARDRSREAQAYADALGTEFKAMRWWQRIPVLGTPVTTSTFPDYIWSMEDPGWVNSLNGALSPEEACLLRPLPKWAYVKPLMPDLRGKSVLEIGCNNGFFSFAFADELGAAEVLGVDVMSEFLVGAQWLQARRADRRVQFQLTDILLDQTVPHHDVVFMSEVHQHFVDPFLGILRAVNLAKEALIIDGVAGNGAGLDIDLSAGLDPDTGRLTFHAWLLSDGLLLAYLYLCGVEPERVTRYVAPWQNHVCYVIDTSGVEAFRKANNFNPCNTSFLGLGFKV